ncbi:MAG: carbohydrate kinase family protein [Candidatus Hodarchaeota archaeon]
MFDIVIMGHLCLDIVHYEETNKLKERTIKEKNEEKTLFLGGPPAYAGLTTVKLGASVGIVSVVGKDFPEEYLQFLTSKNIDINGVNRRGARSTKFVHRYSWNKERFSKLITTADKITKKDVPEKYFKAKSFLISPVMHEISPYFIIWLRETVGKRPLIGVDPQGFLRTINPDGTVYLEYGIDFDEIMRYADILSPSEEEAFAIANIKRNNLDELIKFFKKKEKGIFLITRGSKGSIVIDIKERKKTVFKIPPCKPKKVVDTTGAGDAFLAAFIIKHLWSEDVLQSTRFASAATSFLIEEEGTSGFGSLEQVETRLKEQYDEEK